MMTYIARLPLGRLKQYHAVREEYLFENASNVTKLNMYNFLTTN